MTAIKHWDDVYESAVVVAVNSAKGLVKVAGRAPWYQWRSGTNSPLPQAGDEAYVCDAMRHDGVRVNVEHFASDRRLLENPPTYNGYGMYTWSGAKT